MARKTLTLEPSAEQVLEKLGTRIKKARLRRNIKAEALAERAGISKGTLTTIEHGGSSVSIGAYVAVLCALGMLRDLELVAIDEEGKKRYREWRVQYRKRATRQKEAEK